MPDEKPEYISIHDRQREFDAKRNHPEPKNTPQEPVTLDDIYEEMDEMEKILDKINGKLGFFVFLAVIAIVISIISVISALFAIPRF